jgi:hypothetical protein
VRYVLHQGESLLTGQIGQWVSNTIRCPPYTWQYLTESAKYLAGTVKVRLPGLQAFPLSL